MKLGESIRIKPKAGVQLRKENGQILAADGETVVATSYWLRRFKDGDIEEVTAPEPVAENGNIEEVTDMPELAAESGEQAKNKTKAKG